MKPTIMYAKLKPDKKKVKVAKDQRNMSQSLFFYTTKHLSINKKNILKVEKLANYMNRQSSTEAI